MGTVHQLHTRCIRVVALSLDGARDFCTDYLGVPPASIARVIDAGPNKRPEKYKPEARTFHVFLRSA